MGEQREDDIVGQAKEKDVGSVEDSGIANNSAARVHAILSKAAPSNGVAYKVWAGALGMPNADTPEVTSALSRVLQELELVEQEALDRFPENQSRVKLKHFPSLKRGILAFDLNGQFTPFKDNLKEAALDSLESLAVDLEQEPIIPKSELMEISNAVHELFDQISHSDLNKKLKQFILSWLSKIRRALDQFQITGPKGLQDALTQIQGEACIFAPVAETIEKEAPSIWDKMARLFGLVYKVSEIAERCRKLTENQSVKMMAHLGFKAISFDSDLPHLPSESQSE